MKLFLFGQQVILSNVPSHAEGSSQFACFTVEKDTMWKNFDITVRFRHMSDENIYDIAGVEEGKEYFLPSEVLKGGTVYLSVLGVSGGNRISTTNIVSFYVENTLGNGETPFATPDAYAQYVELVRRERQLSEKARQEVGEILSKVEEYLRSVSEYAEVSKSSSAAADKYRQQCDEIYYHITLLKDKYVNAEAQRVEGENSRVMAENERKNAEVERKNTELERKNAELERKEAESIRQAAYMSKADKMTDFEVGNLLVSTANGNFADGKMKIKVSGDGSVRVIFF